MTLCHQCRVYPLQGTEKNTCRHCYFQMVQFFDVGMLLLTIMALVLGFTNVYTYAVVLRLALAPVRSRGLQSADKNAMWFVGCLLVYNIIPSPAPFWIVFTMTITDLFITLFWSMSFINRVNDRSFQLRGATAH